MQTLEISENLKTRILEYKTTLMQDKNSLQREQKRLLSIFDNAKDDFNNNKIESAVADIKKEISHQKNRESAIKPNIYDYLKQENYKRKHKFSTWLKSCIVKPFPTWSDDGCEVVYIVVGLILGWMIRLISFGLDSRQGVINGYFMVGCDLAFSFSIPSAVKAFYFKNGSKFGIFYFVAELIMLIGSIIWFCAY